MKDKLIKSILVAKAFPKMQILIITFISILLLMGCKEEKIPKLTEFVIPKILPPDSSLACQVKDTIVEDTLFVKIVLFNKSNKSVYIPLNNWYIYGWPNKTQNQTFAFNNSFPDYYRTYDCNILLFCSGNEWDKPHEEFVVPGLYSFPLINKLNSGDSITFIITIINNEFIYNNLNKVKVKGNILYSLNDNHKKLIKVLKIDEEKIIRIIDTVKYTFDFNDIPFNPEPLVRGVEKPFVQYSDSSKINLFSVYPEINENSLNENSFLFRKLFTYYCNSGFNMGYVILHNYNKRVEAYKNQSKDFAESDNNKYMFKGLFSVLLSDTYCYSVKFKNY